VAGFRTLDAHKVTQMPKLFMRPSVDGLWPFAEPPPWSGRGGLWFSLIAAIRARFAALAERRRLWRAQRQLEALDDRLLQDIGIGPSEIRRVVRHGRR
jgi:uncharacterized protein YjiS (DUF1127 family)